MANWFSPTISYRLYMSYRCPSGEIKYSRDGINWYKDWDEYNAETRLTEFFVRCEKVLTTKWKEVYARDNKRPTGFEKYYKVPRKF